MFRPPPAALVLAAALVLGLPGATAGNGAGFVGGIEDLPLMPGLVEAPEAGMVFDTAAGRIVETYATGPASVARVVDFYAATLPQLGWRRRGEAAFGREGELLRLEFLPGPDGELTVRFSLSPAAAAQ